MNTSHEIVMNVASYMTPRQVAKYLKAAIARDGLAAYNTEHGAKELRVSIRVEVVGKDDHPEAR